MEPLKKKAKERAPVGTGDWRLQATHVFLTYACPADLDEHPIESKELLLNFLKTKPGAASILVSKEFHKDGKTHYHAYIKFVPKLNSRNKTLFDFIEVHPNITPTDNWKKTAAYIIKDGDYITFNLDLTSLTKTKEPKLDLKAAYRDAFALASQGKLEEAEESLRDKDPVNWAKSHKSIKGSLADLFESGEQARNPVLVKKDNWLAEYAAIDVNSQLDGEDYVRTHILVGATGIGKTQLAKYLLTKAGCKNIVVVRSVEMLQKLGNAFDGIVFDECCVNAPDIRGSKWTREAQIALVDRQDLGSLPARYSDVYLKAKTIRIITTNDLDRALNIQDAAIARRITVHDLMNQKLFVIV